ncbi:MAG: acyl-ACP--UDP-N-acetylglucosamine O-acyltransferase [Pyrinomonadaceae bacterium]
MPTIHSTAIIGETAKLADSVRIGPFAVIEDDVIIGPDCEIAAHAVIKRFTVMGARNRVAEHAVLGGLPQDTKFGGEESRLVIGDDNLIREFVTLHRASGEGRETRIGNRNFLMIGVHIAHNCLIGDDNIMANGVALAGHITVEDHAFLASNVGGHQFIRIGRFAMVGGKSKVVQDILPFCITDGNPPHLSGLNSIGLRRAGFEATTREELKRAYRILFRSKLPFADAMAEAAAIDDANVAHLLSFIRDSKRGFHRPARRAIANAEAIDPFE